MGTVTKVTRVYSDFPVSALHHMTGMTVHATDLEAYSGTATRMVTGELTAIMTGSRVGIAYVVLRTVAGEDVATVRDTDCVTVSEQVTLCSEHGLAGWCDCATIAAELAGQD